MFFSLLVAFWMTYEVAGAFSGPLVPLVFSQEPMNTVARKNEPVTLNCGVQGSPPPSKITWEKDGQQIVADSRRSIASSGALIITRVIHKRAKNNSDVGEYQCFASSSMGRIASHKVHLDIAGMSRRFNHEPQSTTTWEGSVARFSCQIHKAVPPATIIWQKDGSSLNPSDRIVILDQGVLQIKNIKKADEGKYRCIAKNVAKTRQSQFASLIILSDADGNRTRLKFLGQPRNVTVTKGGEATLECAATGYPVPLVRWKKLNGIVRVHSTSHGVNNLNFSNIRESDGGKYECQASSEGKTIFRSVWLFVRVPPQFTTKPSSLKWTTTDPIELKCAASGSPVPSLSWLKNGNELSFRDAAKVRYYEGGAVLTISSVTSSDSGMYQCLAENNVGNIQATASVIVHRSEDQPGPPTNIVALPHSSSSIIISWSPPVGNYSIRAYTVHYRQLDTVNSLESQDVVGQDTNSRVVSGLFGFTNYSLYVKAYTKVIGRESEIIVQRTLQGSPSRPPVNVNVSSQTPDSLDVTWQPPPKDYRNGIITKYVISYQESGPRSLQSTLEVPGNILKKTINGLSKGKTYSIAVSAATVKGNGPSSRPVTGMVLLQSTNVISPPTLWIAAKNSSVLNVKWLPPNYGQDSVKEYHLFYVQLQDDKTEKGPFIVGKQQRSYFLEGLSPGSQFVIKVMAWDGKMLGLPGAVLAVTDIDPAAPPPSPNPFRLPPSAPIHLVCSVDSPTSILLTWQRLMSSERVAYYTVKYYPRGVLSPVPVVKKVYSESIIMPGLTPGKEYSISVQSHHQTEANGLPDVSTTQKYCKIPLTEPSSPPRNVKFEYSTVTSVDIKWEPPVEPNGEVTSYEIYYTYNSSYPDSKWMVKTYSLGLFSSYAKELTAGLVGIKEDSTFYLKIRAKNEQGYGPFCKTVIVQPPSTSAREAPNVTYTIISSSMVQFSWLCPRVYDAFIESFTVLFANDRDLPEDKWKVQTVVIASSDRFPDRVTTTMSLEQINTYYVKVRAEYDDKIPGKWSKILQISADKPATKDNTSLEDPTQEPGISQFKDNPEFNVKLGIIIGCAISAFCIVVLLLFIVWRNPCRKVPLKQSREKATVNGLPPLNGFLPHHQQIAVSARQDNSASTEETSASSGMCQCRCTCGAGRWPLGPTMARTNNHLPGSSDSSTPMTRQMFTSSTPGGDSEESAGQQDFRSERDHNNSGSSSSSLSVELRSDEQINTIPASSRSHMKSISVDV